MLLTVLVVSSQVFADLLYYLISIMFYEIQHNKVDNAVHSLGITNIDTGKARIRLLGTFWRASHESARGSTTTNLADQFAGQINPASEKPVSFGFRPSP